MLNPRRVLTKGQILQNVWHYDFGGNANVVETYVSYLRKKLDSLGPPLIKTVRQAGYMLEAAAAMSRLSLRARLVLGVLAVAAVGLLIADAATYAALRSSLFDRVDQTLDDDHRGRCSRASSRGGPDFGPRRPGRRRSGRRPRLFVEVRASDGTILCTLDRRSSSGRRPAAAEAPRPHRRAASSLVAPGERARVYFTVPATSGGGRYRVRASTGRARTSR